VRVFDPLLHVRARMMVVMVGLRCAEGPDSEDEKNLHQPKRPPDKGRGLKLKTGIGQVSIISRFVSRV
jgi:hypothetical protein